MLVDILNIIKNETSFLEEERPNYSASRILKISNRTKKEKVKNLLEELFDFMITSVKNSDNVDTLGNIFEILSDYLNNKYKENEIKNLTIEKNGNYKVNNNPLNAENLKKINEYNTKRDILMEVVLKFMNEKPKHRKPVNYKINKIIFIKIKFYIFHRFIFNNLEFVHNENISYSNFRLYFYG